MDLLNGDLLDAMNNLSTKKKGIIYLSTDQLNGGISKGNGFNRLNHGKNRAVPNSGSPSSGHVKKSVEGSSFNPRYKRPVRGRSIEENGSDNGTDGFFQGRKQYGGNGYEKKPGFKNEVALKNNVSIAPKFTESKPNSKKIIPKVTPQNKRNDNGKKDRAKYKPQMNIGARKPDGNDHPIKYRASGSMPNQEKKKRTRTRNRKRRKKEIKFPVAQTIQKNNEKKPNKGKKPKLTPFQKCLEEVRGSACIFIVAALSSLGTFSWRSKLYKLDYTEIDHILQSIDFAIDKIECFIDSEKYTVTTQNMGKLTYFNIEVHTKVIDPSPYHFKEKFYEMQHSFPVEITLKQAIKKYMALQGDPSVINNYFDNKIVNEVQDVNDFHRLDYSTKFLEKIGDFPGETKHDEYKASEILFSPNHRPEESQVALELLLLNEVSKNVCAFGNLVYGTSNLYFGVTNKCVPLGFYITNKDAIVECISKEIDRVYPPIWSNISVRFLEFMQKGEIKTIVHIEIHPGEYIPELHSVNGIYYIRRNNHVFQGSPVQVLKLHLSRQIDNIQLMKDKLNNEITSFQNEGVTFDDQKEILSGNEEEDLTPIIHMIEETFPWGTEYSKEHRNTLFEIALLAKNLKSNRLFELISKIFTDMIRGKSEQEIQNIFLTEGKFTQEEEDDVFLMLAPLMDS
eukprot:TRINITY_DN9721_c0_g1_i1.p1 TRINITY_DN9721_c0_g1~~TRINITY_DN9721_c0_g1_i1.p1  ORF type:complete len:678 (+),score=143.33 TRINITY_DN9721_c0_g1_i1:63-2096(+)